MAGLQVLSAPQNQPTLNSKVITKPTQPTLAPRVLPTPAQPVLSPKVVTQPAQPTLNAQVQTTPQGLGKITSVGTATDQQPFTPKLSLAEFGQKIKQLYPDYSDRDDIVLAQAMLSKFPQYADRVFIADQTQQEEPKSLVGFGKNFVKGAAGVVVDTAKLGFNSLIHPKKTLESFADPIVGLVGKLIPGASTEQQTQMADSVGTHFKNRYGSVEAIKKTAYEDPFGFALDVATILDAGGSLLGKAGEISKVSGLSKAGKVVSKAGDITNPINVSAKVIEKVAAPVTSRVAGRLETSAVKQYSEALSATTKRNKQLTEKVVPGLLEKNVTALTKEGLQAKAQEGIAHAAPKLEEAYAALPPGTRTNIKPIFDDLQKRKMQFVNEGVVVDEGAFKTYENIQRKLLEVANENVSTASLRKLRQIWDKATSRTKQSFGLSEADTIASEARKAGANAIRSELALEHPEIARINAEFTFWSNVDEIVSTTISRTRSQTGLLEPAAQIAGLATGSSAINALLKGIALKNLVKLFRSTGWRTISATKKYQLAQLLAGGKGAEAGNLIKELLRTSSVVNRNLVEPTRLEQAIQ